MALSPDGTRVAVHALGDVWLLDTTRDLATRLTVDSTNEQWPVATAVTKSPEDVSPDGRFLPFRVLEVKSRDLWALPVEGDRKPFPVVNTEFEEREGQFSPDGRWIAYVSNASGRFEVTVTYSRFRVRAANGRCPPLAAPSRAGDAIVSQEPARVDPITLVLNWQAGGKQ